MPQKLFLRSFISALLVVTATCVPPSPSGKQAAVVSASTQTADPEIVQDGPTFTHDIKNEPQVIASTSSASSTEPLVQKTETEREVRPKGPRTPRSHTGRAPVQSLRIPSGSTNHQNYPNGPAAYPGYSTYDAMPNQDWNSFFDGRTPFHQPMSPQGSPMSLHNHPSAVGPTHQNFVYVPHLVQVPTWILVPQVETTARPRTVHPHPRGSYQGRPKRLSATSRPFQRFSPMGSTSSSGSSNEGPHRQIQILGEPPATRNIVDEKSTTPKSSTSAEPNSPSPEVPKSTSPEVPVSTNQGEEHLDQVDEIPVGPLNATPSESVGNSKTEPGHSSNDQHVNPDSKMQNVKKDDSAKTIKLETASSLEEQKDPEMKKSENLENRKVDLKETSKPTDLKSEAESPSNTSREYERKKAVVPDSKIFNEVKKKNSEKTSHIEIESPLKGKNAPEVMENENMENKKVDIQGSIPTESTSNSGSTSHMSQDEKNKVVVPNPKINDSKKKYLGQTASIEIAPSLEGTKLPQVKEKDKLNLQGDKAHGPDAGSPLNTSGNIQAQISGKQQQQNTKWKGKLNDPKIFQDKFETNGAKKIKGKDEIQVGPGPSAKGKPGQISKDVKLDSRINFVNKEHSQVSDPEELWEVPKSKASFARLSPKMQGVKAYQADHDTFHQLVKAKEGEGTEAKKAFVSMKTQPQQGVTLSDGAILSEVYGEKQSEDAKMELQKLNNEVDQVDKQGPGETSNDGINSSAEKMKNGLNLKNQRASTRRSKKNKKSSNNKNEEKALLLRKEAEQFEKLEQEMNFDQGSKSQSKHEEMSNPKPSALSTDKLTNGLFGNIQKIKEKDYQLRDEKFSSLIQKAFHPSTCPDNNEIYPGIFKRISRYYHDEGRWITFSPETNAKFGEDGEFTADYKYLYSVLLNILHEHLQLSNSEDYLSLSEMEFKTYKHLQLVWSLDPQLVFDIPKCLKYQISKPEFYRRLETLRTQISQHSIVENWTLVKKELLEDGRLEEDEAVQFENDFQMKKMFPSLEDFSLEDENNRRYRPNYFLMSAIMGDEGVTRNSLRQKLYETKGKIPNEWKLPSLLEYYRYKGCNYLELLDLVKVLGSQGPSKKFKLGSSKPEHKVYLENIMQPKKSLSINPWYESSSRHWIYSQFGIDYEIQLANKCVALNRATMKINRHLNTEKSQSISQLKDALEAYPGDFIWFGDWGLDMNILKLLALSWNEQGENGSKKLNWELIDSYLSVKLNERQRLILESWFKEKIK